MNEAIRTYWPIVVSFSGLVFMLGLLVQQHRARDREDRLRDKAAEDREQRIRKLEERPHPGTAASCLRQQAELVSVNVHMGNIMKSLERIEKHLLEPK